ncbi:MAG: DUF5119 domain-containing protein [Muribaculaceae bacterium]|nr:DUF5119 domain-containing protein [Muribaculaceae bacterium]
MKKKGHILLIQLIVLTLQMLLSGACNHIELDYPGAVNPEKVEVIFDWGDHPDASPQGMTVYFFRLDLPDGRAGKVPPIAFDFKGSTGGRVSLPPGRYAAICHNNDTDCHSYVGFQEYGNFGLRLTDLNLRTGLNMGAQGLKNMDDERIVNSPDDIWISAIDLLEIKKSAEGSKELQTVRFMMKGVVHRYTFVIHNPVNFSKSMRISAAISGMSGTLHPGRGMTGEETVTHIFEMYALPSGGLMGELLTFGHCGENDIVQHKPSRSTEARHTLAVTATLTDGQTWQSVHDVTEQIHNSSTPDARVVLDSLVIPKPIGGGGWSPGVADWEGNTEFIGM